MFLMNLKVPWRLWVCFSADCHWKLIYGMCRKFVLHSVGFPPPAKFIEDNELKESQKGNKVPLLSIMN